MTQNLNEREQLWIDTVSNWAAVAVQVGVLRQTRGWVRWTVLPLTAISVGQACRKTGALVGYELARKDEEADAAAQAAMERAEMEHLENTAVRSWSNSGRYPGPV